jgi:hypothetical protein
MIGGRAAQQRLNGAAELEDRSLSVVGGSRRDGAHLTGRRVVEIRWVGGGLARRELEDWATRSAASPVWARRRRRAEEGGRADDDAVAGWTGGGGWAHGR